MTVPHLTLDRFTHDHRTELLRWSSAAADIGGWHVGADPDTGGVIARAAPGSEYASLARGETNCEPTYLVHPDRGRWELIEASSGVTVAMFRTLTGALEAVCKTLATDAA